MFTGFEAQNFGRVRKGPKILLHFPSGAGVSSPGSVLSFHERPPEISDFGGRPSSPEGHFTGPPRKDNGEQAHRWYGRSVQGSQRRISALVEGPQAKKHGLN